jgi:hypothetical protein
VSAVDRAAELRAAFDASFAAAPSAPPPQHRDVLRVRAGGVAHDLALAQVASLHASVRIVPVPSPVRELLGVVAVHGAVVPIYDLAAVLRCGAGPGGPRWIAIARGGEVGFAFDAFDGLARVDPALPAIELVALVQRTQGEPT